MRPDLARTGLLSLFMTLVLATGAAAQNAGDVRACNAGNRTKCEEVALSYEEGSGGAPKDPLKKIEFLEKACALNSGRACNNIGVAWSEGEPGVGRVDNAKAQAYYRKACDLKHGLGCFNYANVFRLGEGVPIDPKSAFDNFKKACDLTEAKGCTELGIMYYDGKVVPKDVAMTKTLLDKACKLGSEAACKNIELLNRAGR